MRNEKVKRILSGSLAVILCVSMNINPMGVILSEIASTEFVKKLGIIGDNIQYVLTNKDISYTQAENASDSSSGGDTYISVDCNCNTESIVNAVNTAKNELNSTINSNGSGIREDMINHTANIGGLIASHDENVVVELQSINQNITRTGEMLNSTIITKANEIMANDDKNTEKIITSIEQAQHEYKVTYLYSVNNMSDQVLWRPHLEDLPSAEAIPIATTGYAAVYTGFWNAGIDNTTNKGVPMDAFGIQNVQHASNDTQRALEILGYDAIVRAEGYKGTTNGKTGTYVQELIEDGNITWGDAIQVLYKALGQEQYSYSYFTTANNIQPETSPLSQGLSNVTTFDTTEGAYYLFVSRSDRLVGDSLTTLDAVYWKKAQDDGLVYRDDYNKAITWEELIQLTANMMELYGEPVLTIEERNALLQVYGLEYPIQLGEKLADAWSYLKARGVLSESPTSYVSAVSRDELLDLAMRIKDPDSRLDYKKIQLTMTLEDAMIADGFYPTKNMKFTTGGFSAETKIDYKSVEYYDYFILASSTKLGFHSNEFGTYNISPNFETVSGKKQQALIAIDPMTGQKIPDAKFEGFITDNDKNVYYYFKVPKEYKGIIRIDSGNPDDVPAYIDIDPAIAGGGVYSSFTLDNHDGGASIDSKGIMVTSEGHKLFKKMKDRKFWLKFTDWDRAKSEDPKEVALIPNPTIKEYLAFTWNKWTTPMEVKAADMSYDGNTFTITLDEKSTTGTGFGGNDFTIEKALRGNSLLRLLNSTATLMTCKDNIWYTLVEDSKTETEFKDKVCKFIDSIFYTDINSTAVNLTNLSDEYRELFELNFDGTRTDGVIGDILLYLMVGGCGPENGLIPTVASADNPESYMSGTRTEIEKYRKFYTDWYNLQLNGSEKASINAKATLFESGFKYFKGQLIYIYRLLKLCDITDINIEYTPKVVSVYTGTGFANSVSNDGPIKYMITCPDSPKISDVLGEVCNLNRDGVRVEKSSEYVAPEGADSTDLSASISSSTIMNSMNKENILISWNDLLSCRIVEDTFKGQQPTPDPEDNIYFLQTALGVVKVNPEDYSILIGSTYYNLRGSDSKGPRLVYTDKDGNVYFDYRCIMGLTGNSITETDGVVTEQEDSIGTGSSVIYTLNSSGVGNPAMELIDMNSFNWPNLPGDTNTEAASYTTNVITSTILDNETFKALGTGTEFTYWNNHQNSDVRMPMVNFIPTANWVSVIKIDSAESEVKAGLFVWYPREAFISGNIPNLEVTQDIHKKYPTIDKGGYEEIEESLKAAKFEVDLEHKDSPTSIYNESYWWNAMTYDAYQHLLELSDCVPIISEEYVVRYFDLTDNSIVSSFNMYTGEATDTNQSKALYWIEGIGFVYNIPNYKDWNLSDYMNGKIMLPMAYVPKSVLGENGLIYINPDVYPNKDYGYSIGIKGFYDLNSLHDDSTPLGLITDLSSMNATERQLYSYPDISDIKFAPAGIHVWFGGIASKSQISESSFNEATLNANHVYLGSQRLYYAKNTAGNSKRLYYFGCKYLDPVEIEMPPVFYIVNQTRFRQVYFAHSASLLPSVELDHKEVDISALQTTDIDALLDKLKLTYLLNRLDDLSSWIILCAFYICPMIGWILVTVLVGLSFATSNQVVQMLCDKFFDPIKMLTLGNRDVHNLTWKNSLMPCLCCYIALALIMNGNIIKLTAWLIDLTQLIKDTVFNYL